MSAGAACASPAALLSGSLRLGVSGIADVVEVRDDDGSLYPVEYKRGRPKSNRADQVQLCAQALCLEEMLARPVPEGALFYGRSRRRRVVAFDSDLRALTERVAADTRTLLRCGRTPPPEYEAAKCEACSLQELCQAAQAARYRRRRPLAGDRDRRLTGGACADI